MRMEESMSRTCFSCLPMLTCAAQQGQVTPLCSEAQQGLAAGGRLHHDSSCGRWTSLVLRDPSWIGLACWVRRCDKTPSSISPRQTERMQSLLPSFISCHVRFCP